MEDYKKKSKGLSSTSEIVMSILVFTVLVTVGLMLILSNWAVVYVIGAYGASTIAAIVFTMMLIALIIELFILTRGGIFALQIFFMAAVFMIGALSGPILSDWLGSALIKLFE